MIHDVIDVWLTVLNPLKQAELLTAVYGLVRTGKIQVDEKVYNVPKLLTSPEFEECSSLNEGLLLNSNERAVIFVQGERAVKQPARSFRKYASNIRVVVWYDESKFFTTNKVNLSGAFLVRLLDLLEAGKPGIHGAYTNIEFSNASIVEGWTAFNGYNFIEETGYLREPYRAFVIEGTLTFYLNKYDCQDPITIVSSSGNC